MSATKRDRQRYQVSLHVTSGCNLDCVYCYVPRPLREYGHDMTFATAIRATQMLLGESKPGRTLRMQFAEVEPLLNLPLMQRLVPWFRKWCRDKDCSARFGMMTNGTLIQFDTAKWLTTLGDAPIAVSIDGPPLTHDALRPTMVGGPSHEAATHGLEMLHDAGYPQNLLCISMRFSKRRIDLYHAVYHAMQYIDRGWASWLSILPAWLPPGHSEAINEHDVSGPIAEDWDRITRWLLDRAKRGERTPIRDLMATASWHLCNKDMLRRCGAGTEFITVDWAGRFYACERRPQAYLGSIEDGLDYDRLEAWASTTSSKNKQCLGCPDRKACGGLCRDRAIVTTGSLERPDPVRCAYARLLKRQVLRIIEELGDTGTLEAVQAA